MKKNKKKLDDDLMNQNCGFI